MINKIENRITKNYLNINHIKYKNIKSNNFIDYIKHSIQEINNKFVPKKSDLVPTNTIMDIEKSTNAIRYAIQIRNKIITSYKEIMSIQI